MKALGVPALLALVLLAPALVDAHGGGHGFQQGRIVGQHFVSLEIPSALVTAGAPLEVVVLVTTATGQPAADVEGVGLTFAGPGGIVVAVTMEGGNSTFSTDFTFPEKGTWRANVTLRPTGTGTEFAFPVYANSPYIVDSPNAGSSTGDLYVAGRPADAKLRVFEARTGERAPATGDATARVEHWTDDHATKLFEAIVPLDPAGPGLFTLKAPFPKPGMYHVFFASPTLKLAYEDRPFVHMYALSEEDARGLGLDVPKARGTPAASAVLVLVGLVAVAVALGRR